MLSGGAANASAPEAPVEAVLEEEDILDLTAELGELEPVEEPLVPADVEMVEVVVETAPAAPPPPSASDEAASALERAIAALRAGQLPTSSSEFTTTSTPVFQTQPLPEPVTSPEPPAAVAEPEPELAPEPEIVLTEFEAELIIEEPVVVEAVESELEQAPAWEADAPSFAAAVEHEAEFEAPRVNGGSHHDHAAAKSQQASDDTVKKMLRPMIRQWLDEIMEPGVSEMRRGPSKGQAKAARPPRARSRPASRTPSSLATTPPIETDIVDASVFSAKQLPEGSQGQVQVFLHRPNEREIVKEMAAEADPETLLRDMQPLIGKIARGKEVTVVLEGQGLEVDDQVRRVIWSGNPCKCRFQITVPSGTSGKVFHPAVVIHVDSIPIGSLRFAVRATRDVRASSGELHGERFRHYRHAFLSYASQDRSEVLKRAQLLPNLGIGFFADILSLKPGERWAQRVLDEIDRSDVFFLFWSSHAKASEEVGKEIKHALKRQGLSQEQLPDIKPVVLEGPPPPEPPDELKHIHFNDPWIYVLAASRA